MSVKYIDYVTFRDGAGAQDVVGYSTVEHLAGWVVWRWSDETLAIPSDRIADISTREEWEPER